jgi:hyaluronan synthase
VRPDRRHDTIITLLTFVTLVGVLAFWLRSIGNTVFWVYSVLITGFLLFMYVSTRGYRPLEDMGFRPRVTVVIPAKNEEEVIESVVQTVFRSDYPLSQLEVIVVDDGSTDRTWERIQQVKTDLPSSAELILIRHEKNYGKRIALASAVSRAHGDFIVCIDSDSFVERDAIKFLVQPLQDSTVTAVCGHGEVANASEGLLPKLQHYWYAEMFRLWKGMESRFGVVSCCSGMLSAYRRTSILPIINQWLQEKPRAAVLNYAAEDATGLGRGLTGKLIKSPGEDRILTAVALSQKSARAVYQSNAVVRTIVPGTLRQFMKQQLRWNRAWIHGSIVAGRFMWKKSIGGSLSFYMYLFLTVFAPAVVILWTIIEPLRGAWIGEIGFFAGILLVGFLHGLNTWNYGKTSLRAIPYRIAFVPVSFFLTLTVLLYAWATPWRMGWITRMEGDRLPPAAEPQPVLIQDVQA